MADDELDELKRADRLQGLVMTEGWKDFTALLNNKIGEFMGATITNPLSPDLLDPRKEEQIKGAIFGITFVRDLPHVIIASAKEIRARRAAEEE